MNPQISIIIPCYNVEKYLDKCIQGVIGQNYANWEAILVDDGSTDNTPHLCYLWQNTDNRIRVIHQQNQGASVARNTGIAEARGKYICFVDSDDTIGPDYLKALFDMHTRTRAELTISGIELTSNVGEEVFQVPESIFSKSEFKKLFYLQDYQFLLRGPTCKLFDLSVIQSNHLKFDRTVHFGEDAIFVLQYCLHIQKIAFSNNVSYHYFRRPSGLVYAKCHRRDSENEIRSFSRIFKEWAKRFGVPYFTIPYFSDTLSLIYNRFFGGSTLNYSFWQYINSYSHLDSRVYQHLYPAKTTKARVYQRMLKYTPHILGALEYLKRK